MKNLKRILSLALASVMVMGMMVVGASAADFNDKDQIDHTEAVETLVALGIISGKEGNRFDPKGNLNRAEMATIIAVIRNRGIAPNFGTKATPTYSDIDGHWAESYIEYCSSFGIVGGIGGGKFDPEGTLTATQAARMILNAMGYTIEDPSNWALLTEVQAREEGIDLYAGIDEEITDPTNAKITRDQMAQMTYNALYAPVAGDGTRTYVWRVNGIDFQNYADASQYCKDLNDGSTAERVLTSVSEKLGAKYLGLTDTVIAVNGVEYNTEKKTYTVGGYTTTTDVTEFMGQSVKVLYKNNANGGKTVFGMIPVSTVLYTGAVADLGTSEKENTLTLAGTEYKYFTSETKDASKIYTWNTSDEATKPADWDELTVIDNNGDGVIDTMITKPMTVKQVTKVTDEKITLDGAALEIGKDILAYEGVAEKDWVLVTAKEISASGMDEIAKAPVTSNVTATYKTTEDVYTIGGEKYELATGVSVTLGTAYDLIAKNGYVLAAATHSDGTVAKTMDLSKVAYVSNFAENAEQAKDELGNATDDYSQKVELMFTDGTKKIVEMVNLDVDKNGDPKPVASDNAISAKGLYTFTVKDEKYSLVALADDAFDDYVHSAETSAIKDGKQGKLRFNNDAVLFVAYTAGSKKVEVMTGAEINEWESATGSDITTRLFAKENKSTGFSYVDFGLIDLGSANLPGAVASDKAYGYVVSSGTAWDTTANNGQGASAVQVTIWNGAENETRFVDIDSKTADDFVVGTVVTYQVTDGDFTAIEEIKSADKITAGNAAVLAYEDGTIVLKDVNSGNELGTSKTTIIYIDSAKKVGSASGVIKLADKDESNAEVNNVFAVYTTDSGKVTLNALFVDVNNKIATAAAADDSNSEGGSNG